MTQRHEALYESGGFSGWGLCVRVKVFPFKWKRVSAATTLLHHQQLRPASVPHQRGPVQRASTGPGSTRGPRQTAAAGRVWVTLIRRSGSLLGWAGSAESGMRRAPRLWSAAMAWLLRAIRPQIPLSYDQIDNFTGTRVSTKHMPPGARTNSTALFGVNPDNKVGPMHWPL